MVRFDILPRLLPDRYYDTHQEALEEVSHRRASQVADDAVTQFEKLPYGSYRVYDAMDFAACWPSRTIVKSAWRGNERAQLVYGRLLRPGERAILQANRAALAADRPTR